MKLPKNWPLDVPKSDDARYAAAEALDAAYAAAEAFDRRYDRVPCFACGETFQLIDWGGGPHRLMCEAAASPPPMAWASTPDAETLDADTPEDWERIAGDRR